MFRLRIYFPFLLLLLFCGGCASFLEILGFGFNPPEVHLRSIEIRSVSMGSIRLDVKLAVRNPNAFEIKLNRLEYTITASEIELAKGMIEKALMIPKEGQSEVKLPLTLDPESTMRILSRLLENPKVEIPAIVTVFAVFETPIGPFEKTFVEERPLRRISL